MIFVWKIPPTWSLLVNYIHWCVLVRCSCSYSKLAPFCRGPRVAFDKLSDQRGLEPIASAVVTINSFIMDRYNQRSSVFPSSVIQCDGLSHIKLWHTKFTCQFCESLSLCMYTMDRGSFEISPEQKLRRQWAICSVHSLAKFQVLSSTPTCKHKQAVVTSWN